MAKNDKKGAPAPIEKLGKNIAPAKVQLPATGNIDFSADAGQGQENVRAKDLLMPMIGLLQDMSPFVKKSEGAYIPGAEAGMLINTATHEIYDGDTGVLLVPCFYEAVLIEWVPRDNGGGLVKIYPDDDPIQKTTKRRPNSNIDQLPNGNDLVRTAQHYCLLVDEETGDFSRVVVPLSSTGLKKSRLWNSLADNIRLARADGTRYKPASFSHLYRLTAVPEKNKKGSYFNVQPAVEGPVTDPALYAAAREFYNMIAAGEIRAVPQRDEAAETTGASSGADPITKPEPNTLDQGQKRPY